jgi:hypothetical protein
MATEIIHDEYNKELDNATQTMLGIMLGTGKFDHKDIETMCQFLSKPLDTQESYIYALIDNIVTHSNEMSYSSIIHDTLDYIDSLVVHTSPYKEKFVKNKVILMYSDIYQKRPSKGIKRVIFNVNFITSNFSLEINSLANDVSNVLTCPSRKTIEAPSVFYYSLEDIIDHIKAFRRQDLNYIHSYADIIIEDLSFFASISNGSFDNNSKSVSNKMSRMTDYALNNIPFIRAFTYYNLLKLRTTIENQNIIINSKPFMGIRNDSGSLN